MMVQRGISSDALIASTTPRSGEVCRAAARLRSVRAATRGSPRVTFTLAIVSVMLLGYVMLTST